MTPAQEARPLDRVIPRKVRERYMRYFEGAPLELRFKLDMDTFKRYFADVAHEYNIVHHEGRAAANLTADERESRRYYNRYFGIARKALSSYLKRKRQELEEKESQRQTMSRSRQTPKHVAEKEPIKRLVSPGRPFKQFDHSSQAVLF